MSWILHQIVTGKLSWLIYVVACLVLIDIVFVYLAKFHKPALENKYYEFHKRHGFLKTNILKVGCVLFFSFLALQPPHKPLALVIVVVGYFCIVMKLLSDFIREKIEGKLDQS